MKNVLFYNQILEAFAINIALNKNGKYCNIDKAPQIIFDGDTNFSNSYLWQGSCINPAHAFLKIDLMDLYTIQYVIVYHGPGEQVCFIVRLSFRTANLSTVLFTYPACFSN